MQTSDNGWPEIFPREPSDLISKKEQQDYPWVFQCGIKGCYWRTAHPSQEHAQSIKETHICGQENRQMPRLEVNHSVPAGPSIVEKFWVRLDDATKAVMESVAKKKADVLAWTDDDERKFNEARGNARGIAGCIFVMSGYYESENAVAKHAVARYKASVAGEDMPPTIGVNGYNPQLDAARARSTVTPKPVAAPPAPIASGNGIKNKQGKLLSENDITAIKGGLGVNLPESSLAAVYKITVEDVARIKASMNS